MIKVIACADVWHQPDGAGWIWTHNYLAFDTTGWWTTETG